MNWPLIFISLALLACFDAEAQSVAGEWQGTSTCQIKSSSCNNEEVVYHITAAAKPNTYTVRMNKVVSGKEEEMGALTCTFNETTKELVDALNPDATWTFKVGKRVMRGTLIYRQRLYRVIRVKRVEAKSMVIGH